jgi:hypothetical protein
LSLEQFIISLPLQEVQYPWHATNLYTVADRDNLYQALNRQIVALTARIAKEKVVGLDQRLVYELLQAGLNCPAFNERQKFALLCNSEMRLPKKLLYPELKGLWPFDTLVMRPDADEEQVMVQ